MCTHEWEVYTHNNEFHRLTSDNVDNLLDREPRTVIHVKRAKGFDPMG